jgi:glycosyltransferase involved in cell wall biosynthesis
VEFVSALGVSTSVLPLPHSIARLGEAGARGTLPLAARLVAAAFSSPAYVERIRQEIREFKPDVIHTNSLKMHLLGADASRTINGRAGPPVVWHMHDYLGNRPTTARLLKWRNGCAAVIANSESVAADVRAVLGNRLSVTTVLNAVDLAGLPPAAPGTVRVGLVATFGRWKGQTTFLDAVARLPRDLPVRAYIVGDALYQPEGSQQTVDTLRRYASDAGAADRVGFTGFVARPEEAMRGLDVVVHASTAPEPFGLVIAEAMACERAVIASDAGGAREVFTDGVDALAHAPGDADGLARQIEALVRDAPLRQRLARAGRRTAEQRFNRDRLAQDLIPLYQRVAAA